MTPTPQSLSGLWPFIRPYRWQVACAGLFLVLAAGTTLAFPWALRTLIDQGLVEGANADVLATKFVELFLVAVALAIFSAARFYTVSWLGEKITVDVKNKVYAHVLQQSPTFFETTQSGEVLSRLSSDATLIQTVVGSSLSMGLRNLVMGVGAMAMLVWTNPWLMFQVMAVLALVVFPSVYLGRRVRRLSRASQDRAADSSALASEVLNAISVVQSYTAEGRETQRFADSTAQALGTSLRRVRARSLLVGFIIVASSAALLWGLYMGALSVRAGTTTAGELGQTVVYVILLASAFAVLGEVYGDVLRAAGATERLMELLHTRSDVRSPDHPQHAPWLVNGSSLVLRDVNFNYPSRPTQQALNGLCGEVQAGQTVAIVGPSGAGKTTLFSLLMRFYAPQHGEVLLDGVPIAQMDLSDLRQRIGVVPQEPVVFSGSVMDNIRYGKPDATDKEVHAAAEAAFAHEFIAELPQGYDTAVGRDGLTLSGGQAQRVGLARAIYGQPKFVVLDEPSSSLDQAGEQQLIDMVTALKKQGVTFVLMTHRKNLIEVADKALVLRDGVQQSFGSRDEVMATLMLQAGGA